MRPLRHREVGPEVASAENADRPDTQCRGIVCSPRFVGQNELRPRQDFPELRQRGPSAKVRDSSRTNGSDRFAKWNFVFGANDNDAQSFASGDKASGRLHEPVDGPSTILSRSTRHENDIVGPQKADVEFFLHEESGVDIG